ncbi:lysophospholipase [Reichenbachiella sp. MALMAid0571]|uniref:alpha/beta hydrolase n=1 Tax=Reichenbachiella sp. MALMAid0571 TaxID=3143939 RepID=UPI0032DEB6CB
METDYFNLTAKDGAELKAIAWSSPDPKAVLCIVHGLGEHSGRYQHVAEFFVENNISVFAFDLRGHGKSEGKRGHTPSHEILLDDVEEILKAARAEYNDLPLFLYGHSFGGNIVANYTLIRNTNELSGAILSSSWLKAQIQPSALEFKVAKIINKIFPSFTQGSRFSSSMLTKDAACNDAYENDPLVHRKMSVRLGLESYDAGRWAIKNASRLKIPTLVWHGSEDEITSSEGSKQFAENAGSSASFKLWEGVKHEPHNDLEKEEVLNYLLEWILMTMKS